MRQRGEESDGMRKTRHRVIGAAIALALSVYMLVLSALATEAASDAARWSGVDEAVIEKVAKEHGRTPVEPLINTDQGDLLLFLFLLAGATAGFIAGYNWRKLTERQGAISEPPRPGNVPQD